MKTVRNAKNCRKQTTFFRASTPERDEAMRVVPSQVEKGITWKKFNHILQQASQLTT
jgi:hypothetical protein